MLRGFIAAIAAIVMAGAALSQEPQPLRAQDVAKFAAALPKLQAYARTIDTSHAAGPLDFPAFEGVPQIGSLISTGLSELRAREPSKYAEVSAMIRKSGFASAEEFAAVGDRVLPAFAALTMKESLTDISAHMADMDPALIAQLPAASRAQLEAGLAAAKFIESVPDADKEAVRPHFAALNAAFDAQGAQ